MLLLRGAQTVAELPGANRPAASVRYRRRSRSGAASASPRRPDALARELPRQPGQRETRWIHLAGTEEVERDLMAGFPPSGAPREQRPASAPRAATPALAAGGQVSERLERLEAAVAELHCGDGRAAIAVRSELGDLVRR